MTQRTQALAATLGALGLSLAPGPAPAQSQGVSKDPHPLGTSTDLSGTRAGSGGLPR